MYKTILQPQAEKFLKRLDKSTSKRIIEKLRELEQDPSKGIPLIGNLSGLRKLRVGDYRIIYQIQGLELIILVLNIGHRKNIYD